MKTKITLTNGEYSIDIFDNTRKTPIFQIKVAKDKLLDVLLKVEKDGAYETCDIADKD